MDFLILTKRLHLSSSDSSMDALIITVSLSNLMISMRDAQVLPEEFPRTSLDELLDELAGEIYPVQRSGEDADGCCDRDEADILKDTILFLSFLFRISEKIFTACHRSAVTLRAASRRSREHSLHRNGSGSRTTEEKIVF